MKFISKLPYGTFKTTRFQALDPSLQWTKTATNKTRKALASFAQKYWTLWFYTESFSWCLLDNKRSTRKQQKEHRKQTQSFTS